MNEITSATLAKAILDQTVYLHWGMITLTLLIAFLALAGAAYAGAYFSKKAEHDAAHAQIVKIVASQEAITKATKRIETDIAQLDWMTRERIGVRRAKLEQLFIAAHSIQAWLDARTRHVLFNETSPIETSPLTEFQMLIDLFFPELEQPGLEISQAYFNVLAVNNVAFQLISPRKLQTEQTRLDFGHGLDIAAMNAADEAYLAAVEAGRNTVTPVQNEFTVVLRRFDLHCRDLMKSLLG